MTNKTKSMCSGCRDDFYNHNRPGGCWRFLEAKVLARTRVGIWQNPPYRWSPQATLSCHSPEGSVWIKEDDPRIKDTDNAQEKV